MDSTFWAARSPRRMIAPRPNCFSIWRMAASTARPRSPFFSTGTWAVATGASISRSAPEIIRVGVPAAPDAGSGYSSSRGSRSLRLGLITSTEAGGSYAGEDVGGSFGAFSLALRFGCLRGRSLPFAIARTSDSSEPVELRRSCAAGPYQPITRGLSPMKARGATVPRSLIDSTPRVATAPPSRSDPFYVIRCHTLSGVAQERPDDPLPQVGERAVRESSTQPPHELERPGQVVDRGQAIREELSCAEQVGEVGARVISARLTGAGGIDRSGIVLV